MILIEHRVSHVIQIVSGGVAKDQCLHHRRNEQAHSAAPVLQYREQLLARQREDSQQRVQDGIHAKVLRMTARLPSASAAAIAARASVFGTITDQTSPARNTVCSSAT